MTSTRKVGQKRPTLITESSCQVESGFMISETVPASAPLVQNVQSAITPKAHSELPCAHAGSWISRVRPEMEQSLKSRDGWVGKNRKRVKSVDSGTLSQKRDGSNNNQLSNRSTE